MQLATASLVQGLEATHRRVETLLAGVGEEDQARQVPATPAWTVQDVLAHLADGEALALALLQGGTPEGMPGEADLAAGSLDEWTAAGVARWQDRPYSERLRAFAASAAALRAHLAALDPDGWKARVPWAMGPVAVRTLGQLRLHEAWVHGHDVAEALGVPFGVDGTSLAWMADLAVKVIPGSLARGGRAHPGAAIRVVLDGAGEWLVAGAPGPRPAPGTRPDLTLEADPLAFVLFAAGRRREPPWRASGGGALAADVAATLTSVG